MYPFLSCIIVFCLWLRFELNKSSRHADRKQEGLLELERKANSTRRQPIDNLHYITFSEKNIPIIEINDNLINKLIHSLLKLTDKKIVKLSQYTNTELKQLYGPANFPALSEYDENFSTLVGLLHKYAVRLNELSYTKEAVTVLEYSVEIGTDMGSSYKLLADLYHSLGYSDKLKKLLDKTDNVNELYRGQVTNYIKNYTC